MTAIQERYYKLGLASSIQSKLQSISDAVAQLTPAQLAAEDCILENLELKVSDIQVLLIQQSEQEGN